MLHGVNIINRWQTMTLAEQMGNIGAEVSRLLCWEAKRDEDQTQKSLARALELIDLSIADSRWNKKELCRLREVLCSKIFAPGMYNVTAEQLNNYFLPFAILARKKYA
ncbi:MAG: hypothetical protein HZC26_03970 [Candidatus Magasanikbacteria bacterium]|nr:hypothetical protein [Candidatus Magasanikbacteria bacterium]